MQSGSGDTFFNLKYQTGLSTRISESCEVITTEPLLRSITTRGSVNNSNFHVPQNRHPFSHPKSLIPRSSISCIRYTLFDSRDLPTSESGITLSISWHFCCKRSMHSLWNGLIFLGLSVIVIPEHGQKWILAPLYGLKQYRFRLEILPNALT